MEQNNYLIIGLGNPGAKYAKTRHNIGYSVAKKLITKYNASITRINRITDYAVIKQEKINLIVSLPLTYMNLSGIAAKFLIEKYNVPLNNVIVVVDEYNFPIPKVHLKLDGSSGGHNGIASIIDELSSTEFYRLRCGIERNFGAGELVDYVLSTFKADELDNVKLMIDRAIKAIEYFTTNDTAKALSYINSGKLFE